MGLIKRVKRKYWHLRRLIYGVPPNPRQIVVNFEVQKDARLQAYWKDVRGPGASLFVRGTEVLRFDCFGANTGHYHMFPALRPLGATGENRIYFREQTIEGQIERTFFEITRNARYYLQRSTDPEVQKFKLDMDRIAEEATLVRDQMLQSYRTRKAEGGVQTSQPAAQPERNVAT